MKNFLASVFSYYGALKSKVPVSKTMVPLDETDRYSFTVTFKDHTISLCGGPCEICIDTVLPLEYPRALDSGMIAKLKDIAICESIPDGPSTFYSKFTTELEQGFMGFQCFTDSKHFLEITGTEYYAMRAGVGEIEEIVKGDIYCRDALNKSKKIWNIVLGPEKTDELMGLGMSPLKPIVAHGKNR